MAACGAFSTPTKNTKRYFGTNSCFIWLFCSMCVCFCPVDEEAEDEDEEEEEQRRLFCEGLYDEGAEQK